MSFLGLVAWTALCISFGMCAGVTRGEPFKIVDFISAIGVSAFVWGLVVGVWAIMEAVL